MNNSLRSYALFWAPLFAWAVLILVGSSIPQEELPHLTTPSMDKVYHFIEYLVLGFLIVRACRGSGVKLSLAKILFLAIMISSCYAAIDEWHQQFVPGRDMDIFDLIADVVGALTGALFHIMRG